MLAKSFLCQMNVLYTANDKTDRLAQNADSVKSTSVFTLKKRNDNDDAEYEIKTMNITAM